MRILLIVILLSFMTGCLSSFKVTGYSGGTVIIYCHYYTEERSHEKYFCKGHNSWSLSCKDIIRTGLKNTWVHRSRFSLYDNTGGNYFKVIIRQLTRQDEGTYWCGVDKPNILDSYTKVELDVKKDDCCEKSLTETAFLGGEATIRCNYPEDHEDSIKYFCKESNGFKTCVNMISANQTTTKAGRFSVSDNRRERFSTVTISDLTEDDTGTYWCGVETSRTEQRYITLITQVKLDVIMISRSPAPPTSPTSSSTPGTSNYPVPSSFSPSSSTSSSIPIGFAVITVSVSLAVLVFTVILFTVYRWKCNNVQGPVSSSRQTSSRPNTHPGNSEEGDQHYENDPAPDAMVYIGKDDAVYQSLNPNAANQDSTYQTLNSNTANQD